MQEIAYTTFGRNALFTGLISHVAVILVAMMPASGAELFFNIVFPFSCFALVVGTFAELTHRGYHPLSNRRFYTIAALTVLPVLGPLFVLGLLYSFQQSGQEVRISVSGLFSAIFRLKASAPVLFVLIIVLFLFLLSSTVKMTLISRGGFQTGLCLNKHFPQMAAIFTLAEGIVKLCNSKSFNIFDLYISEKVKEQFIIKKRHFCLQVFIAHKIAFYDIKQPSKKC